MKGHVCLSRIENAGDISLLYVGTHRHAEISPNFGDIFFLELQIKAQSNPRCYFVGQEYSDDQYLSQLAYSSNAGSSGF